MCTDVHHQEVSQLDLDAQVRDQFCKQQASQIAQGLMTTARIAKRLLNRRIPGLWPIFGNAGP